jgi:soluble lytic murein transglycosylase-like protein
MNITAVETASSCLQPGEAEDKDKQAKLTKFKKACQDFESIFLYYMLKTMRSATNKSSLLGDGLGSEIFTQIFDEGLAKKMAESDQLGIGDILYKKYSDFIANANYETAKTTQIKPFVKKSVQPARNTSKINSLDHLDNVINQAALKHNVDPGLIKAVIWQESGGNPRAISSKGAKGIMQLMDGTARMLGVNDTFDIKQNIFGGVKYLAALLKRFGGDIKKALAAYNAGPASVDKYGGIPPYEETRKYVNDIINNLEALFKSGKAR